MNNLSHIIVEGAFLGISYAVLCAGLAITLNVVEIINLSHGAFYVLGAYIAYSTTGLTSLSPLAYPISFLGPAFIGYFVAKTLVNPLRKDHFAIAVGTLSVAIFFEQAAELIWGEQAVTVPLGKPLVTLGGENLFRWHIDSFALFASVAVLFLILPRTKFGLAMKITAEDEEMARSVGIDTDWVRAMAFSLSCGLASLAGTVTAPATVITPAGGRMPLVLSIIVVTLTGAKRLLPIFPVAITMGVVSFLVAATFHPFVEYLVLLVLILLVLSVRGKGLFTLDIERDY